MRVALNMLFAGAGVAGGKVYCDGLLQGLAQLDTKIDYTIFTRQDTHLPVLPANFQQYRSPIAGSSTIKRTLWEYGRLPRLVRQEPYDLLHGMGNLSPSARPKPFVLTIHDLIYLHFPQSVSVGYRWFMKNVGPIVARRADRILVPSRFTAQDLVSKYKVKEERIRIIRLGPGNSFSADLDEGTIQEALATLRIRRPYIISVARGYAHKNLVRLLQALPLLRRAGFPDTQLVLVGERHRAGDELDQVRRQLQLDNAIIFTGFVDNRTLNALYCGAACFVFPSLAEGFGMPILEAMTCGAPVIASDATALPEIVGNAGLLVDARRPEALADAMAKVLGDVALQRELRSRGFEHVRQFQWDQCARQTVEVYKEMCPNL
jgi:glycosyltransferase involved in cell wall biosynthesis